MAEQMCVLHGGWLPGDERSHVAVWAESPPRKGRPTRAVHPFQLSKSELAETINSPGSGLAEEFPASTIWVVLCFRVVRQGRRRRSNCRPQPALTMQHRRIGAPGRSMRSRSAAPWLCPALSMRSGRSRQSELEATFNTGLGLRTGWRMRFGVMNTCRRSFRDPAPAGNPAEGAGPRIRVWRSKPVGN